jgi:hypothetical protein
MASSSNIETDGALPDTQSKDPEGLVKSKQRVADHGEVFTPSWMVEDMLNLVKTESERIDSRFLEPACGSGNFLKSVLKRKLTTVQSRYGKSTSQSVSRFKTSSSSLQPESQRSCTSLISASTPWLM